jgi:hypothetical protein
MAGKCTASVVGEVRHHHAGQASLRRVRIYLRSLAKFGFHELVLLDLL